MTNRRAVFLDRDGTLIHDAGYLATPEGVVLLSGVIEALKILRKHQFTLVLVSNQSGIGRGLFTHTQHKQVHTRVVELLAQKGISFTGTYYCLHAPWESCYCRKPRPGLLRRAAAEIGLNLEQSFMVGDKLSDVAAGRRAGCYTVLLSHNKTALALDDVALEEFPHFVAPDLCVAAHWITTSLSIDNAQEESLHVR